jgi:hypothetical protein
MSYTQPESDAVFAETPHAQQAATSGNNKAYGNTGTGEGINRDYAHRGTTAGAYHSYSSQGNEQAYGYDRHYGQQSGSYYHAHGQATYSAAKENPYYGASGKNNTAIIVICIVAVVMVIGGILGFVAVRAIPAILRNTLDYDYKDYAYDDNDYDGFDYDYDNDYDGFDYDYDGNDYDTDDYIISGSNFNITLDYYDWYEYEELDKYVYEYLDSGVSLHVFYDGRLDMPEGGDDAALEEYCSSLLPHYNEWLNEWEYDITEDSNQIFNMENGMKLFVTDYQTGYSDELDGLLIILISPENGIYVEFAAEFIYTAQEADEFIKEVLMPLFENDLEFTADGDSWGAQLPL